MPKARFMNDLPELLSDYLVILVNDIKILFWHDKLLSDVAL